jgi:hypothetical protein
MTPRTPACPLTRAALACAWCIAALATFMLALLISTAPAAAGTEPAPTPAANSKPQLDLALHTGSYHFDRAQRFEEFNPGAALRLRTAGGYWQAGAYRNSIGRTTGYIARGITVAQWPTASGAVQASVFAGVGSGYAVRVAERRVFFKTPAPPCLDPKGCPEWPLASDLVRVYEPRTQNGGLSPLAGAALSWDTGPMALHLVATPTFRTGGQTRNYGALALLVSFPLGR